MSPMKVEIRGAKGHVGIRRQACDYDDLPIFINRSKASPTKKEREAKTMQA